MKFAPLLLILAGAAAGALAAQAQNTAFGVKPQIYVGGAPRSFASVTATPSTFGARQVGDDLSWTIDIQTPAGVGYSTYLLVVQTPNNLTLTDPKPTCVSPTPCGIVTTAPGGLRNEVLLQRIPAAAHLQIVEHGTVVAAGPFSVDIGSAASATAATGLVTTISGTAAPATKPPPIATEPAKQPPSATGSPQEVWVKPTFAPAPPFVAGQPVTAIFTFRNSGPVAHTIDLLGNQAINLRMTDPPSCALPCQHVVLKPKARLTWTAKGVVAGVAGETLVDTLSYQVDGQTPASESLSDGIVPGTDWTWLKIALGGAAAAVALVVTHFVRRYRWNTRISVDAVAHADQASVQPGQVSDWLSVRLDDGPAGPNGAIPVLKVEPDD